MHVASACVRALLECGDGTRTRARLHARGLCKHTARGTLPPAFDLESAEARALEHALSSTVLEARASSCLLFLDA